MTGSHGSQTGPGLLSGARPLGTWNKQGRIAYGRRVVERLTDGYQGFIDKDVDQGEVNGAQEITG